MGKDYYSALGVERSATKSDLKKAFHKLARQYHPDNKTTGNEQKFKEINEAYQTLSDDRKRGEYDTYGHVFSGSGGGGHGFGGGSPFGDFSGFGGQGVEFDLGDIFSEFFGGGGRRTRRGRDISIDLEIPFVEAILGTERNILLNKTSTCATCQGSGAKPGAKLKACTSCNGQGRVHETRNSFLGSFTSVRECDACKGQGKIPEEKCGMCSGLGVTKQQEEINVRVPAGIQDGEVIRLSGAGEAVPQGVSGDLYIKVHVGKHPTFRREGANLVMELNIKLSDALLGAEYPIPLLDGSKLKLKIPAGASLGEILRIRGKGIPYERGRSGDLLVKLNVNLPKNLSQKARKLFEELKEEGI